MRPGVEVTDLSRYPTGEGRGGGEGEERGRRGGRRGKGRIEEWRSVVCVCVCSSELRVVLPDAWSVACGDSKVSSRSKSKRWVW